MKDIPTRKKPKDLKILKEIEQKVLQKGFGGLKRLKKGEFVGKTVNLLLLYSRAWRR
jgi:hypothetical protein